MRTEPRTESSSTAAIPATSPRVARGTVPVPAVEPVPGDGMFREPWTTKWSRRAVTIPAVFALTALHALLLPLLLCHGAVVDLAKRRPQLWARFHLTVFSVLVWHALGLLALLGLWLGAGRWLGHTPAGWREWNRRLELFWVGKVIGIAELFYGMRIEVEGADAVAPGPVLILSRHASVLDTILPIKLLGEAHRFVLRIVKKRELLWDPCVDGVSHRLPRTFVRRGSGDVQRELDTITALLGGIQDDEAVVIFPEGTRFTAAKQEQVLTKLRTRDPALARRAATFANVLPPRTAGTFALLDRRPDMDVVFCAHTGLEGANRLEHLVHGALLRRTVKVQFWRVPASEVPSDPAARREWLLAWWERIDRWITAQRTN